MPRYDLPSLLASHVITLVPRLTKVKALFLPEASDYIASSPAETVSLCKDVKSSPFVLGLQALAKSHGLAVNVGVHEPGSEDAAVSGTAPGEKKVKNTSLWIDETGAITQRYQKVHLFDVEIEGGPVLKESNSVEKGMELPTVFNTALGRVGLMICFDVRLLVAFVPVFPTYLRGCRQSVKTSH